MDWLIHNTVGDLAGPPFLAFYIAVIVLTCIACRRAIRSRDATGFREPPPIPGRPDPYEMAYLRGGENEVIRTGYFALLRRGYVQVVKAKKRFQKVTESRICRVDSPPPEGELSALELRLYRESATPRAAAEMFKSGGLASKIADACSIYRKRLEAEELLSPPEVKSASWPTWLVGTAVLLALGGYKLAVAHAKGRTNVEFLVILMCVGPILLGLVVAVASARRLSDRGRAYLKGIKIAYQGIKKPAPRANVAATDDTAAMLMVGVFGLATLKGTAHSGYSDMFAQAATASGSSGGCGGAGCGGGGCGGGGCGGGCGGCGG